MNKTDGRMKKDLEILRASDLYDNIGYVTDIDHPKPTFNLIQPQPLLAAADFWREGTSNKYFVFTLLQMSFVISVRRRSFSLQ